MKTRRLVRRRNRLLPKLLRSPATVEPVSPEEDALSEGIPPVVIDLASGPFRARFPDLGDGNS